MIFVRSAGWKSKVIVLQFSQKRSVVSFLFTETNVQGSCDNLAELSALGYHIGFSKYCLFVLRPLCMREVPGSIPGFSKTETFATTVTTF